MLPPIVVTITRLHRKTAAVVQEAAASSSPVFVTQHSLITAVLLHRRLYDRLLRAAEKGASASARGSGSPDQSDSIHASESSPEDGPSPEAEAEEELPLIKSAAAQEDPLAVFGPLPPGTRFEGPWGIIDAALAAMYLEDGIAVRPILRRAYLDDD